MDFCHIRAECLLAARLARPTRQPPAKVHVGWRSPLRLDCRPSRAKGVARLGGGSSAPVGVVLLVYLRSVCLPFLFVSLARHIKPSLLFQRPCSHRQRPLVAIVVLVVVVVPVERQFCTKEQEEIESQQRPPPDKIKVEKNTQGGPSGGTHLSRHTVISAELRANQRRTIRAAQLAR